MRSATSLDINNPLHSTSASGTDLAPENGMIGSKFCIVFFFAKRFIFTRRFFKDNSDATTDGAMGQNGDPLPKLRPHCVTATANITSAEFITKHY